MEYAVKPLTSEDAEYMEEKIDEFDDVITNLFVRHSTDISG